MPDKINKYKTNFINNETLKAQLTSKKLVGLLASVIKHPNVIA